LDDLVGIVLYVPIGYYEIPTYPICYLCRLARNGMHSVWWTKPGHPFARPPDMSWIATRTKWRCTPYIACESYLVECNGWHLRGWGIRPRRVRFCEAPRSHQESCSLEPRTHLSRSSVLGRAQGRNELCSRTSSSWQGIPHCLHVLLGS
jgi:hypothetical protein